jgi:hypothetical protein
MGGIVARLFRIATLAVAALSASVAFAQSDFTPGPTDLNPNEHWTWGTTAESRERDALNAIFRQAFDSRDFKALDGIEVDYRSAQTMTASGLTRLELFYVYLDWALARMRPGTGCEFVPNDFIAQWRATSPHAPTPIILEAKQLDARAWCHRGPGHADSVAADSIIRSTGAISI